MSFKVGDIVKTKCFGPSGSVGEFGLIIKPHARIIRCWKVLFGNIATVVSEGGLEVVSESR
jgi:hypothetical protein